MTTPEERSDRLFRIVWHGTNDEVTPGQLRQLALREPWAKSLVYCDIEGFCADEYGDLILIDECGNWASPPPGLFDMQHTERARIEAVAAERARIVAWLRAQKPGVYEPDDLADLLERAP